MINKVISAILKGNIKFISLGKFLTKNVDKIKTINEILKILIILSR